MKTRVLVSLAVAAGLMGAAAYASETQDRIIAELQDQGFSRIEVSRTLLGRTRIVAEGDGYEREIILNPASGVVLRDFLKRVEDGDDDGGTQSAAGSGQRDGASGGTSGGRNEQSSASDRDGSDRDHGGNSGSGSGGSGGGSDDDDSDDDDSGDDDSGDDSDNSGSGSDNSGSDNSDDGDDGDDDND